MSKDQALRRAREAARAGKLAESERWSKVAAQLAAAEAQHEAAPERGAGAWEEDEAAAAELRRRLQIYCEASQDIRRWEAERDAYYEALTAAVANNLEPPPPLRPHPAGALGEAEYLRRIAQEGRVD